MNYKKPLRADHAGREIHVIMNAIDGSMLCEDALDFQMLSDSWVAELTESDVTALSLCLLNTHAHAILLAGADPWSIGKFIQRVFARYARAFNRRHKRRGHLLRCTYFRVVVRLARHSYFVIRYIPFNLVEAGIARTPNALERCMWSSHPDALGLESRGWIDREELLRRFGQDPDEAVQRYRAWVNAGFRSSAWTDEMHDLLRQYPGLRSLAPAINIEREFRKLKTKACDAMRISLDDFSRREGHSARALVAWVLTERFRTPLVVCSGLLGQSKQTVSSLASAGAGIPERVLIWTPPFSAGPEVAATLAPLLESKVAE